MPKQENKAADVPAHVVKSTVESSKRALAKHGRESIGHGREDIKPKTSAHDSNSILERYDRYIAEMDGKIGYFLARKRKLLQAKSALLRGDLMGDPLEDVDKKPEPAPQEEGEGGKA